MGTRADFYVGRGEDAEWLGSIAWDGYPDGLSPYLAETETPGWPGARPRHKSGAWPEGEGLLEAKTEEEFRSRLERFFQYRDDVTLPHQGWPWPWETSHTTDFAYAFDGGKVYASCFGKSWRDPLIEEDWDDDQQPTPVFPDMTDRKNVQFGGKRSGLMVISAPVDDHA